MKILIIGDPLQGLKPIGDSSLGMVREALNRKHEIIWANDSNITLCLTDVIAYGQTILECPKDKLPIRMGDEALFLVRDFDTVWIRKDPPFDDRYVTLTWLLSLEERPGGPLFINRPSLLLKYHEKLLPFFAARDGFLEPSDLVPSALSADFLLNPQNASKFPEAFSFLNTHLGEFIVKPWLGHGGRGVEKMPDLKQAAAKALEVSKTAERSLLQPFVPEVRSLGDRRAFFLGGKYVGSFSRMPQGQGFISNIAQGGTGLVRDLTAPELRLCKQLEAFFEANSIFIAGVDLLAERVSEINITSPTGFLKYVELGGPDLILNYLDLIEAQIIKK